MKLGSTVLLLSKFTTIAFPVIHVVDGSAVFAQLPTVSPECNDLFLSEIIKMDPEAQHVVIADQAGFHLRPGDDRVPEGVHLIPFTHTAQNSIHVSNSGM